MMKCPKCGKENRDVARFCQYCGASLAVPASPETTPGPSEQAVPGVEVSMPVEEPPAAPQAETGPEPAQPSEEQALPEAVAEVPAAQVSQAAEEAEPVEVPPQVVLEAEEAEAEGAELQESEAQPPEEVSDIGVGRVAVYDTVEQEQPAAPSEEEAEGVETSLEAAREPPVGESEVAPEISVEASDQAAVTVTPELEAPTEAILDETAVEAEEGPAQAVPEEQELPPDTEEWGDVRELASAGLLPWEDRGEDLVPLGLGTVLNGRYQIVEVLSDESQQVIYRVRDLQRCPRCGFAGNAPDEAFCASCGAAMEQKPGAMMLERSVEQGEERVEAAVEDHFVSGDRQYWVWRELEKVAPKQEAVLAPHLIIGQKSDTGRVRALDEDSLFVSIMSSTFESTVNQLGLLVVADGMGGHEGGEVASRLAIETMSRVLTYSVFVPELEGRPLSSEDIRSWMERSISAANDRVYSERRKRQNDMGTTITAALIKDWTLYLAHVGDCRAFRWSEEGLEQLTTDHSVVAGMIAAGAAQPEEIYTHPQRSVIYRCIGDRPSVEVDTSVISLGVGDRLILCSDGLWEMVRNEGIEDMMLAEPDPQKACDILVEQANLAGGVDNISVIVVQL